MFTWNGNFNFVHGTVLACWFCPLRAATPVRAYLGMGLRSPSRRSARLQRPRSSAPLQRLQRRPPDAALARCRARQHGRPVARRPPAAGTSPAAPALVLRGVTDAYNIRRNVN